LIYGLVMLGLIVVPTAMVMDSPLECTFCKDDLCNDLNITNKGEDDPEYFEDWVKEFCTFIGSVNPFILYFPYILLLIALVMVLMEKIFIAVFRSHHKLDRFYKLLLDQNVIKTGEVKYTRTRAREVIEIEKRFKSFENNYYQSYLVRTMLALLVVLVLLSGVILYGFPVIFSDDHTLPCQINSFWYVCSGHPQEFYRIVLIIAVIIICCYIITNIYNLFWIISPFKSKLGKILHKYRANLRNCDKNDHEKRIKSIYFENKDLKMLIDLLALNKGLGTALQVISIFDKEFYGSMSPRIASLKALANTKSIQAIVEKPSNCFCSSLQRSSEMRMKMVIELCSEEDNPAKVYDVLGDTSDITTTFEELLDDVEYELKVSILINGKIVSTVSKNLDSLGLEKVSMNEDCITESEFDEEPTEDTKPIADTTPLLLV